MIPISSVSFPNNIQVLPRPAPMARDYDEDKHGSMVFDPAGHVVVFTAHEPQIIVSAVGAVMRKKKIDGRPATGAARAPAPASSRSR